jgi:hypothetical protein
MHLVRLDHDRCPRPPDCFSDVFGRQPSSQPAERGCFIVSPAAVDHRHLYLLVLAQPL